MHFERVSFTVNCSSVGRKRACALIPRTEMHLQNAIGSESVRDGDSQQSAYNDEAGGNALKASTGAARRNTRYSKLSHKTSVTPATVFASWAACPSGAERANTGPRLGTREPPVQGGPSATQVTQTMM